MNAQESDTIRAKWNSPSGRTNRGVAQWASIVGVLMIASTVLIAAISSVGLERNPDASVPGPTKLSDIANEENWGEPIRPLPPAPDKFAADVLLGRQLFHDRRLSGDNSISCSSCHQISEGGDDGLSVSVGIGGLLGVLNAPTVLNSGLSVAQFWDGRAGSLESQVQSPVHNPAEMGSSWTEVIPKLSADAALRDEFRKVYGQAIKPELIVSAIAAYERALTTPDSPFDQYLLGDEGAISVNARGGYELFKNIGCVSCHQGRSVGANMFQNFGILQDFEVQFPADTVVHYGRLNVTEHPEDRHRFKVPGLRNVELTAPYFHDGSSDTLEQAIEVMAAFQLGESLSKKEIGDLKAFLVSLTGVVPEALK